jgi:hypothetical protein
MSPSLSAPNAERKASSSSTVTGEVHRRLLGLWKWKLDLIVLMLLDSFDIADAEWTDMVLGDCELQLWQMTS